MNTKGIIGHSQQINKLNSLLAKDMIPQTMLFSGLSGIGKSKIALKFLNAIFCPEKDPPCMKCHTCIQIQHGTFPDMIHIKPNEKGKILIGNADKREDGTVRWLIDRLSKKSISENYGIIIEGADTISISGQNALLKLIEEPPHGTHIILLTSNKSLLLPTILSRCSEINFNLLNENEIKEITKNNKMNIDNSIIPISGGSIETVLLLSDEKIFNEIMALCKEISSYINTKENLSLDINPIQKKIGHEKMILVLLNIYRFLLQSMINKEEPDIIVQDIQIDEFKNLKKIIKILLALRKGLANNLNIKNAFKSHLYSM